jgi:uncharacterized protein involved in exopolysaccharide biosynthesis
MKFHLLRSAAMRGLLIVGPLSALTACAFAQPDSNRPAVRQVEPDKAAASAPVTPPPPAASSNTVVDDTPSTVAALQQLIQTRKVEELRTTYNGTYGASLLFKADDMVYYVAQFRAKNFWRVLKTSSLPQAEATYRAFVDQSANLAAIDIERIRLQAEVAKAERQLATRNSQLSTLQADQALRKEQEAQVAAIQKQSREEAQALSDQEQDARKQLRELQRKISNLQAQQASVGSTATATPAKPKPAPHKHHTTKAKPTESK